MTNLKELLTKSKTIAVLTGAGVSTDSGIPDFQENDETWPYEEPRHELISVPYFKQHPERFWKIYREVFGGKFNAAPNETHRWLASLQDSHEVTIITQNVDGLHQKGGSSSVIEVHGSNSWTVCQRGCTPVPMESVADQPLPRCATCRKPLKPAVSLFGDGIHGMGEAREATVEAELFLIMGTALEVGPINELPYFAGRKEGSSVVWLNRDEPPMSHDFIKPTEKTAPALVAPMNRREIFSGEAAKKFGTISL